MHEEFVQVGVWGHYENGKYLQNHVHNYFDRTAQRTYEALYMISGSMDVEIFTLEREHVETFNIHKGQVANLKSSTTPRQPMRVLKYRTGCASELLTRCKYFQVERLLLNTEVSRDLVNFQTDSNSFHALLCVDGCGSMSNNGFMLNFFKGDCIFVPADSIQLKLHGRAQILNISC